MVVVKIEGRARRDVESAIDKGLKIDFVAEDIITASKERGF